MTEEKVRLVTSTRSELRFSVEEKTMLKLQQLKELIGDQGLERIFDSAIDALLLSEQKKRGVVSSPSKPKKSPGTNPGRPADLKEQSSRTTETPRTETQLKSRFIPIDLKRVVFARSKGQCEHIDPRTGLRCKSRFRLQIDHLRPLALGGFTESSNLRHLCSAHNLIMATEAGLWRPHKQSQMHTWVLQTARRASQMHA